MSDRRAVYYDEEAEKWVYSASAIGHCPRSLLAWRLGYDPVTSLMERLPGDYSGEGVRHEDDILDRMLPERGWEPWHRKQEEVEVPGPGYLIRGHIDDVAEHKETHRVVVVDAKSMSENQYRKWARSDDDFPHYLWQLSAYMAALDLPGLIAAKNRNNGELFMRFYEAPPVTYSALKARVEWIEATAQKNDVMALQCDPSHQFVCKFSYVHDDYGSEGPTSIEDYTLESLAREYLSHKANADVATRDMKDCRDLIVASLGEEDADVKCGPYRLRKQTRSQEVKAFTRTSDYLTVEDTNAIKQRVRI